MIHLLQSEFTKFRSVRSTVWSLVAMVVIALGVTTLAALVYNHNWPELSAEEVQSIRGDAIGLFLQPAILFSQVAVCVLGVLVVSAEYSTGTIRATMLARPKRWPVVVAKAVVVLAVVYLLSELVAFGAYFIGSTILSDRVSVSLGDNGVLEAVLFFGVYMCAVAAFSFGLAVIIRNTAGAITAGIVAIMVVPTVIQIIPGSTGDKIAALVPASGNSQMVLSTATDVVYPYSGGVALLAFGAWALAATLIGTALLNRRDV